MIDQAEYVNLYIARYQKLATELLDAKLQLEIKSEILANACNEKDARIAELDEALTALRNQITSESSAKTEPKRHK